MTTSVTVDAHAGWPVEATITNPVTGVVTSRRTVPAGTKEIFYIHADAAIQLREIQPNVVEAPPVDGAVTGEFIEEPANNEDPNAQNEAA